MDLAEKIKLVKEKARKVYEETYTDTCTIKVYRKVIQNGLTKTNLEVIASDIPCKLGIQLHLDKLEQKEYAENENRYILMLSPTVDVPLNSQITVNNDMATFNFISSYSHKFRTHQLIILLDKRSKA